MSCPLCAKNIEKQILRVIPAASVKIDLGTGAVEVRSSTPPLDAASKIRLAIISAGFTPGEVSSSK
jgi:copper chaperone CopZ